MTETPQKRRVIVLGFDGMDYDLTKALIEKGDLPNLAALARQGHFAPLQSVFPPDSIPSWITMFTGLDPSDHGVLDHVNYLLPEKDSPKVDTSVFHGKTLWDRIGNEAGAEVCIVNPYMAYPVWPVNGVMISGPVFMKGDIQVSDPARINGIPVPKSMGGIDDLPGRKDIKPFYERTLSDTQEQADFGLRLFRQNQPGFFFQTFYTTDRIQHHLWRYCNPSDPTYPGPNEVEHGIHDFFVYIDQVVGSFMKELAPGDLLMLMSDHGHGMRCTHCFNLNEYLRRKGYLKGASKSGIFNKKVIIEKLKNKVLRFMHDHDLEDYISKIAKLVPNARELKKGTHITNYSQSMAYAPDFAGTNPFGGIFINKEHVGDYRVFRDQLISEMKEVTHQGRKVFKWLRPREELYHGKHINRYPDILYEMVPDIGTGYSTLTDLITVNPTHKKISGGHKENGIFFLNNSTDWVLDKTKCKMTNMHATILGIYGLSGDSTNGAESFLTRK